MSTSLFSMVVIGSSLLDTLVATVILSVGSYAAPEAQTRLIGMRVLLRTGLATGLFFLVKLPLLSLVGLHRFGVVHLLYIDLVVVAPLIGAGLLVFARGRRGQSPVLSLSTSARLTALLSLTLWPVGVYATWIEPFRLRLETAEVAVPRQRAGHGIVRIGVLTDLQTNHVSDYERSAVDRLMAQKPDVILLPGDLFQGARDEWEASSEALHQLLGRLSAPGGVYVVLGDTDGAGDRLRAVLPSTEVRLLVNESVSVQLGDRRLTIGGLELNYASPRARRLIDQLEMAEGTDDVRILLAHRPDVALGLRPGSRVDLVVAGHTHGGQVVIPGFGPPVTLSHVPRAVAAGGLHTIRSTPIYVSRGVGCERGQAPRIRFLCPPEISLLSVGTVADDRSSPSSSVH